MSNLIVKATVLAGTDIHEAILEAHEVAQRMHVNVNFQSNELDVTVYSSGNVLVTSIKGKAERTITFDVSNIPDHL